MNLRIEFTAPPGRILDDRYGPSTLLTVAASPSRLLRSGDGAATPLQRTLQLDAGEGVLQVSAQAASCDDDPAVEHPACYLARQDWGVPVRVVPGGPTELTLMLLG